MESTLPQTTPAPAALPRTSSRVELLGLLAGLAIFALGQIILRHLYIDDAWISFRYAKHWGEGLGPVYNVDGTHVEGYTNFLWVALLAGLHRLGLPVPETAKVLGGLLGAGAIVLLWGLPRRFGLPQRLPATALLVGLSGLMATACAQGLETALLIFLMVLLLTVLPGEAETRVAWRSALVLLALALTRPDGLLCLPVAVLVLLVLAFVRPERRQALLGNAALLLAVAGAGVAMHMLWRHAFYGDWLPNTFYAKAGPVAARTLPGMMLTGLSHWVATFWGDVGGVVILCWALAAACMGGREWPWLALAAGLLLARMLFVAVFGEAYMGHWRFMLPTLVLALCLVELSARRMLSLASGARALQRGLLVLLVLYGLFAGYRFMAEMRGNLVSVAEVATHEQMAAWLQQHAQPGDGLAMFDAGMVPYKSPNMRVIDTGGLNDRTLARLPDYRRGNPAAARYVMDARPRFILLWTTKPWPEGGSGYAYEPTTKGLQAQPELRRDYRFAAQWHHAAGHWFIMMERK